DARGRALWRGLSGLRVFLRTGRVRLPSSRRRHKGVWDLERRNLPIVGGEPPRAAQVRDAMRELPRGGSRRSPPGRRACRRLGRLPSAAVAGRYLEDFKVGDVARSAVRRTMTQPED